jgi:D-alanyl-D-alanine carboxypeptidase
MHRECIEVIMPTCHRPALTLLSLVVSCGLFSGCIGEPDNEAIAPLPGEYQAILDEIVATTGAPGGVMGIMSPTLWAAGASGVANLDTGEPMTPDMKVRIASMTKTFTAAVVMKLVDEGLLSLDDTLEKWLPGVVERSDQITLRMILNHTAGIHDGLTFEILVDWMLHDPDRQWSQQEMLDWIGSFPLDFDPGTDYSYSNAGYYILGVIVERATGKTFQEALDEYVLSKKGLKDTEVIAGLTAGAPTQFYSVPVDGMEIVNVTNWNLSWDWTAGSGVTTVSDMLHFLDLLFVKDLLSPQALQEMTTVTSPADRYGFGMNVTTYQGKVLYSHSGANPGNISIWVFIPEINSGFFFALNRLDLTDLMTVMDELQSVVHRTSDPLIAQETRGR